MLIVEDGSAKADAESYVSVAVFRAYWSARGVDLAASDDVAVEAALRTATDYLTGLYRQRWHGVRRTATQKLDWPRVEVPHPDVPYGYIAEDVVPREIGEAVCVLGREALAAPLVTNLKQAKLRVKVGPIETDYDPNSPRQTRYVAAARLVAPYVRAISGGGMVQLVRA